MATISENLQTLTDTLELIKTALTNKGVIPSDALTDVPDEIDSIQTGGDANLTSVLINENGVLDTPPAGYDGWNYINVQVPEKQLYVETFTTNGIKNPPAGYDGWSQVEINVQPEVELYHAKVKFVYVGNDSTFTGAVFRGGTFKLLKYNTDGETEISRANAAGVYNNFRAQKGSVLVPEPTQLYVNFDYSTDNGTTWQTTNTKMKPSGDAKAQFAQLNTDEQEIIFEFVKDSE